MTGALGQIGRGADGLRVTAAVRALAGVAARYWEMATYAALLVTAAAMRFWDLGSRAIHHDESLHAYYAWRLSEGMGYTHDPMMHGPFQFESTAALFFVFGAGDVTARVLYAAAGSVSGRHAVALQGASWPGRGAGRSRHADVLAGDAVLQPVRPQRHLGSRLDAWTCRLPVALPGRRSQPLPLSPERRCWPSSSRQRRRPSSSPRSLAFTSRP